MTFDGLREVLCPMRSVVRDQRLGTKLCDRDGDRRVQMAFGGVGRYDGVRAYHAHFLILLSQRY